MVELTDVEARVLGCLIEKEVTTPDYYPLTLNALTLACNQKSNRDPVVEYDEKGVVRALDGLREKKLAWMVHGAGSRVPKYEHRFGEMFALPPERVAVMCLLLLRGAQTAGELRSRSGRLHAFVTVADVEVALQDLMSGQAEPLAAVLPLQHGAREPRYVHLLCGPPSADLTEVAPAAETARVAVRAEEERFAALEEELARLRAEVEELQQAFATFRRQFE
ncbi:MAG: YceH family protein [Lentisphaeria bacterium]|nr:YceH family protein [Lentisphaeria bacterium]